jgi:hypothetical protein
MIEEGFLPPQHRAMIIADEDPSGLLDAFRSFAPVTASKWMG